MFRSKIGEMNHQTVNRINSWLLGIILLLLVAFFIRIHQLGAQSLWWDEGISLHLATSKLIEIMADRLNNIHPPLYFILLKGWLSFLGVGIFIARFLSVLSSWLLVPFIWTISRRWFGRKTAFFATILATISSVSIIYAQEIRVYAILPLIYAALLILTWELVQSRPETPQRQWVIGITLGFVSLVGLHLHYITLFVVAYVFIYTVIVFLYQRRITDFIRWLAIQAVVLIVSLPWLIAVLSNWSAVQSEANAGTYVSDPVPLRFLFTQVWTFLLTGLPGAAANPVVYWLLTVTGILLIVLLILRIVSRSTRDRSLYLAGNFFIPLLSALVVWSVRSFSHPRYISMFIPGLIFLVAGLVLPNNQPYTAWKRYFIFLLSLFLTLGISISSIWGVGQYFLNEDIAKDDMRGVARYLEQNASHKDLIIIPDTDWSFPFEYNGEATVIMPGVENDEVWSILSQYTQEKPRIFTIDYQMGTRDWQGLLAFALEKSGHLEEQIIFDRLILRSYQIDDPISPPNLKPANIQFAPLILTGYWVEQNTAAGEDMTLALRWRLNNPQSSPLNVAVKLLDANGFEISTNDKLLIDKHGRPSTLWEGDEEVVTYHRLSIPPATPGLDYALKIQVYSQDGGEINIFDFLNDAGAPQGQEIHIDTIKTKRGKSFELGDEWPVERFDLPFELSPGFLLIGSKLSNREIISGQNIDVRLLWQASRELQEDLRPELILASGGQEILKISETPAGGFYPTTKWRAGEQVLDRRKLTIPPKLSGPAQVFVRLGEKHIPLGEVEIVEEEHLFEIQFIANPVQEKFGELGTLVGFELSKQEFRTDEEVPLTLYWKSNRDGHEDDLVIFTHILSEDGRLIGQHDGRPDNSQRPTTSWVNNEYILDRHVMAFRDTDYSGSAIIEVGIYDPESGERLLTADGRDHFILPISLNLKNP